MPDETRRNISKSKGKGHSPNGTILLVEDNSDDVELTIRALKRNGFINHVVTLNDGAQALDYLQKCGPYEQSTDECPALVLLDLKLPRIDGLELLGQIKADPNLKTLPVIMLTSSKQERDVSRAYQLGVNSYVCKPTDFSEFVDLIGTLGHYWFSCVELPPAN